MCGMGCMEYDAGRMWCGTCCGMKSYAVCVVKCIVCDACCAVVWRVILCIVGVVVAGVV